ncbi:MAG: universal stress protein [Deltaproteobacteria bacterium]|nr:MAG: universal stress protein [Deltaproteobacteria bacterium]
MSTRLFLGVEDSPSSLQALENLGHLFMKGQTNFHLFQTVPESYLPARPPSSVETMEWESVQKRKAQQVLDKAVSSLLQMGYKRSRLSTESRLQSANTAQDILDAGRKAETAAVVLVREQPRSRVKRFVPETTVANIYQYADLEPVWAIGALPLKPPHILAAVDESEYADRIVTHVAETLGPLPDVQITLYNVMPAKPPAYWDDGHILDKSERAERGTVVKQWRWEYEEVMGSVFAKARGVLTKAGIAEERITTRMETRRSGVARDILAEASRGGYNILAFGRRGSGKSQFELGSRASRILRSARDCTLILVN